jgi:hypothetical protein
MVEVENIDEKKNIRCNVYCIKVTSTSDSAPW